MKTKHIKIAQALIAVIFVFAVAYFILGIMSDKKAGPGKVQERFDTFMMETATLSAKYEPNSPNFNGEFTQLLTRYRNDFAYLRLDVNNKKIYEYPAEDFQASETVTESLTRNTTTLLGNTLTVTASMLAISQTAIYNYAKVSFILILTGTIAAVVLLFIIQMTAAPRYRRLKKTDDDFMTEDDVISISDEKEEDEETAENDDDFDPISAMEEENRETAEDTEEDILSFEDETETASSAARPQALLEAELQTAISRSAQEEADLSLLIIRINPFREDADSTKEVAAMLSERMGNQGVTYGYNDGFALMINNTNLDSALAIAQSLYGAMDKKLNEDNSGSRLAIGLSSRSERIITAQRLITEAEQAVLHAADDKDSPIIAFRVNPEKYREYMNKKN
ncbi:MAG: hypothetical protein IKS40_06590 [Treponema sp.]|nr:hypothetical protein [Treponema sp.]